MLWDLLPTLYIVPTQRLFHRSSPAISRDSRHHPRTKGSTPSQAISDFRSRSTSILQQDATTAAADVNDGPVDPRAATLRLADAQWNQAQRYYRYALNETYRLRHGTEPPAEMRILETSALERSRAADKGLLAALDEEKRAASARGDAFDAATTQDLGPEESDHTAEHQNAAGNSAHAANAAYSGCFM